MRGESGAPLDRDLCNPGITANESFDAREERIVGRQLVAPENLVLHRPMLVDLHDPRDCRRRIGCLRTGTHQIGGLGTPDVDAMERCRSGSRPATAMAVSLPTTA